MTSNTSPSEQTKDLSLYYSETCWFCARVRQVIDELGIVVAARDIDRDTARHAELIAGGGKGQVPCLRIESTDGISRWMYESADIAAYLVQRFGAA